MLKGQKTPIETRRKMSEAAKGKHPSAEILVKLSESHKGNKHTDEAKRKIGLASKGNKYSLGFKHSIESRRKNSEGHKGLKRTEEQKKKMGLAHKGWKPSEETRKKMSLAKKGKPSPLLGRTGYKFSEERRRKASESRPRGDKASNWKGGITPIHRAIRTSFEYRIWREAVFKRDNWTCIWGGKEHGSNLHADHIKRFSDYPELRFAIDNGRTLCVACHKTTDTYGRKKSK